jgi:predicted phage terminase large subunit-like protein
LDIRQLAKAAAGKLHLLTEDEKRVLLQEIEELEREDAKSHAQNDFMGFVKRMWPGFIPGKHHEVVAKAFENVVNGHNKRLIINMAPRHTKSEFASYLLPAWFLGKNPNKKIIQTSHTAELAVGFGRKVRNLIDSEEYNQVFTDVKLKADNKSAGRWATNKGGEYFSIGVGGSVTGKGADLLIIDDPHSEQEAKLAAHKPDIFDSVYEWYTSGPRQRLQPGGAIIIVMCMTGDTPVLMADGTEKPLGAIRKNDLVATFDKGLLTTSKVNNWRSSGVDAIYKIQTRSGKILRANKRHPFLVMNEGVLEWTRLEQLRVGDLLVSLKGAAGRQGQKQNLACADHANQKKATTEKTLMHHAESLGITENGKVKRVLKKVARSLFTAMGYATTTTPKNTGLQAGGVETQSPAGQRGSNLGTGLLSINTMQWLQSAITNAMYAVSPHQQKIHAPIGMGNCALTTATIPERFEGSYVTTATSQLDTEKLRAYLNELHRISDFTVDPIISIDSDGQEEVFDVEIDRTENFIANGVVSHNTRWSLRDLTGQVIKASQTRGGDEWEVIELPAIMPSGKPVWPEFWKLEELLALKEELPVGKWNAQYQQQPTAEEGAIVKREWWKVWEGDRPPPCDFVIQSWDTAFLKHNRADFSACTTWGVWTTEEGETNIILLDAFKDRYEFPELKQKAYETYREWEPDVFLVEAKAAGSPLVFELRRMGIPVSEYSPTKGNDKIVRLNAVSDLFASGRIWVPERKFADELIEEVAAFPSGEHDDLCLVGETMITMADGSLKRIDEIRIGEMVATPEGPCKVIDAKCTGKHETIKLNIENTSLQITPNHPVATQRGWIPAGQINPTDAILMLSTTGGLSWDLRLKGFKSRLLSLMGIGTAGIPEQNNLAIGGIFQGQTVYCTGTSGNFIMAPYQQVIKFTTKTGTHQIIDWKTWSALASKTTDQNTKTNIPPAGKQSFSKSILKVLGTWPQRGTAVQKALHGIRNTPKEASLSEIQTGEPRNPWLAGHARFAQKSLKAITLGKLSVPQLAHLRSETISCAKNGLTSLTSVCAATLNSLRFKPKRSTVVESATKLTIESAESSLVYNLTVDRASCYFANGVLVHNCDSMTQALLRFRTGGFLSLQSDDEDREPMYRRKVAYY